jgi:hypothetical protein
MIKEKESKCMGMQHNSERARRSNLSLRCGDEYSVNTRNVGHCAAVVRVPGNEGRQRWFERRGATRRHGMRVLELDVARRQMRRQMEY